ncbi:type I-E CRISPR-associated endoribonuclease Cas2e [Corynebacterium bovis]|uniref:type I-E CRISPR-associated endoribonuclease Cas2e n=1 Tax=Corynebacterium bovis TaxID=36808 RepID=UPI0030808F00
MINVVLTSPPERVRGHLTRWLSEVATGVYVGKVSARVRDELWQMIQVNMDGGRAVMTYPTTTCEQGYAVKVHKPQWEPVDVEGLVLFRRPGRDRTSRTRGEWSRASRERGGRTRRADGPH